MNNGLLTASSSPLASTAGPSASPGCVASGSADSGNQLTNPQPVVEYPQCSVNGTLPPLPELNNQLTSANNNVNTTTTSSTAATAGDRFSDSLANLGFPDDSGDAVFHPGLLQDLIDDVFYDHESE
ncbi:uncharacterized protein CEXT_407501 [Caerostris extrusa]|uniref:Uncharacterized protein n=1 Tax=Caerostris extrusa TaxID=172846 RepID=A0AAV4QU80_CAEEX|nr:uncharacterized protein CEXT_407501 [Caerostris extrusa]